jgi:UDP-glucose 4-epimerase
MRVLVTGGAGFVGSHAVELLVARGDEVHVFDNLSRGRREWLAQGVTLHEADLRDRAAVRAAIVTAEPEGVLHLAALHYIPAVDDAPEEARSINVEGTRLVIDALLAHPPGRFVFASTAAVYPDWSEPIGEAVPPAPIDLYGETKLAGERELERLRAAGAACVSARLFNVAGPRETNPHVLPEIVAQIAQGARELELGNVEPERDFVDVRDVGRALVGLLDAADRLDSGTEPAVYNVGSGRATSVAEIVELCARIVDRDVTVRRDLGRVRRVDRLRLVADTGAIRRDLDWSPEWTLERTLADLLVEVG